MATLDQIEGLLTDLGQRLAAMPKALDEAMVKAIVNDLLRQALEDENHEVYRKMRFAKSPAPLIGTKYSRYGLGIADIEWLHDVLQAGQDLRISSGPSEELRNTFKAVSEAMYVPEAEIRQIDRRALDNVFPRVPLSEFHGLDRLSAVRGEYERTVAFQRALKAMDSAESGFGSQLVGAQYVGELWEAARQDTRLLNLITQIDMTDPTMYIPVEVDIPELLFVSESTANNSSNYTTVKTGSQRVQLDAKKFVIHQMWSGEMEEDSIIPFVPFLRAQAAKSLAYYADSLILNGDTTNAGTGNINLDDADPADTKHYLAWDGLRHAGLVDNTANSKDLAGAMTARALLDARERMHDVTRLVHWGFPRRPEDVVHVVDSATYLTMVDLDEVITVDKMGPRATILTGQLASIWGHPVVISEAMSKTEADGKVSTTAGNNTKGQVCTFNVNGFRWGWRRRVKVETERLPATDQARIVYSLRAGFGRFTPTGAASGLEAVDVIYDITV